jgi:hypothetical protein
LHEAAKRDDWMTNWKPEFDDDAARALIGKYVLVGITDLEKDTDTVIGNRQMHGVIVSADERDGIVVRNPQTREEFTLPPITNHFQEAAPGEYRLRVGGEVVSNPDLLCTWSVHHSRAPRE